MTSNKGCFSCSQNYHVRSSMLRPSDKSYIRYCLVHNEFTAEKAIQPTVVLKTQGPIGAMLTMKKPSTYMDIRANKIILRVCL